MRVKVEKSEVEKLVKAIESNAATTATAQDARARLLQWRDELDLTMDAETRALIEATVGKE